MLCTSLSFQNLLLQPVSWSQYYSMRHLYKDYAPDFYTNVFVSFQLWNNYFCWSLFFVCEIFLTQSRGSKHFKLPANVVSWKNRCVQPNMTLKTEIFLRTVLHLSSWDSAPDAYCRITCKPDRLWQCFWYPQTWDPPCQSAFFTSVCLDLSFLLALADS